MIVPVVIAAAAFAQLASAQYSNPDQPRPLELGCFTATPSTETGVSSTGPYDCAYGTCTTELSGTPGFSYYRKSDGTCFCSTTGPDASTFAANPSTDSPVVCSVDADYATFRINSAFGNAGCYAGATCSNGAAQCQLGTYSTITDAFNNVARNTDVVVEYTSAGYTLFGPATGTPDQMACTPGSVDFIQFSRDASFATSPQSSNGVTRRAARLARDAQLKLNASLKYCPQGMTACADGQGHYECLDTSSEVESCGGCVNGVFGEEASSAAGVDCLAQDGVLGALCHKGKCISEVCSAGFTLKKGVCA